MDKVWGFVKAHPWWIVGGAAVFGGILLYAYLHKSSSSTDTTGTQDLLATSGGGPTYSLGTIGSGGGGGGTSTGMGASPVSPASPATAVLPYVAGTSGGSDAPAYSMVNPSPTSPPSSVIPSPTLTANPTPAYITPATPSPIPVGLTGVSYDPGVNTPNQITVGSASGLTAIALPVGETISTPVTVPNVSAGNPVVPLSDLISTGSTNTLSSAYGNAATAAVATQSLNPGQTPTGTAVYLGANPTIVSGQSSPGVNAVGQISVTQQLATGSSGSPNTPVGSVGNPSAAQIAATVKGSTPAVKASLASATKAAAGITY